MCRHPAAAYAGPLRQRQMQSLPRVVLIDGCLPGLAVFSIRRRAILAAPARYCLLVEHASAHDRPARWTRGLLYCGLAAGPVFVTTFLAEGAARDGYRPSRHPVSSLALGPRGRVQAANFAVTGTLVLAGAAGLGRTADPALRGRAGPALIGAAGPASSAPPSSLPTRSAATRQEHPTRSLSPAAPA